MLSSLGRLAAVAGTVAATGAVVYYGSAVVSSDLDALSGELLEEKRRQAAAHAP
jgi:hypothetical protein